MDAIPLRSAKMFPRRPARSSWGRTWDALRRVSRFVLRGRWRDRWISPFIREVWPYHTTSCREVAMHHAPHLGDYVPELLILRWKDELKTLEKRFGFRLPRVQIFLFPFVCDINNVFGQECGGLALPSFNSIVVGEHATLHEIVRHEFVHLFAARWNASPSLLLQEGLAVHLQKSCNGYPIDALVRRFGGRSEWTLRALQDRDFFFERTYRHACYMIAGSFTGYLIDEFGWDAYRALYRRSGSRLFERSFEQTLGVSFQEAESRWQRHALMPPASYRVVLGGRGSVDC